MEKYNYEINWNLLNKNRNLNNKKENDALTNDFSINYSNLNKINNNFQKKHNIYNNKSRIIDQDFKIYNKTIYNNYKTEKSYKKNKISSLFKIMLYSGIFTSIIIVLFFVSTNFSYASTKSAENQKSSIIEDENNREILYNNIILDSNGFISDEVSDSDESSDISNNVTVNNFESIKVIEFKKYRVRPKESVESIARKFGLKPDSILLNNDIKKKVILQAGRFLQIPNQDGRTISISSGDNIYNIAKRYGVEWETIADVNNLSSNNLFVNSKIFIPGSLMSKKEKSTYENNNGFVWPINGTLTSYFGMRKDPITGVLSYHSGIDIKQKKGYPVKPIDSGTVISTCYDEIYGNNIFIKHTNGLVSQYGHLNSILIKTGDKVNKDTIIGKVGSTGRSTGDHLHLNIIKYGKFMNPLKYLQ